MSDTAVEHWRPAIENLRWRGVPLNSQIIEGITTGGTFLTVQPFYVLDTDLETRSGSQLAFPQLMVCDDPIGNAEHWDAYNGPVGIDNEVPLIFGETDCAYGFAHHGCCCSGEIFPVIYWNLLRLNAEEIDVVTKMQRDYDKALEQAGVPEMVEIIWTWFDGEFSYSDAYAYLNDEYVDEDNLNNLRSSLQICYGPVEADEELLRMAACWESFLAKGEFEGIQSATPDILDVVDDDGRRLLMRLQNQVTVHRSAYLSSFPSDEAARFTYNERNYL